MDQAHTDDIADAKARLREQFPGWNFIVARPSGRWWALRPGETAAPSTVVADSSAELAAELAKIPAT
ncbi:MAG: hypothetical protein GEV11_27410 [Streptosporangiales bacterium]|nr:hypothetical protein [Streptosporangiales bacterium]